MADAACQLRIDDCQKLVVERVGFRTVKANHLRIADCKTVARA